MYKRQLEYGPGFFVPYFKKDTSEDVENILSEFRALLESLNFKGKVVLEMGRFLAEMCIRDRYNTLETEKALAPKPTEAAAQAASETTQSYDNSSDYSNDYDYSND